MRLNNTSVLLGLLALGAIPEASCRAVYTFSEAYDVDPFYNVTEISVRAAVVPVKPPTRPPVKAPVVPGDTAPGAAAPAPLKPGGEGAPSNNPEPAPLTPADKPNTDSPDAEPLAPADKPDGTPADKPDDTPADRDGAGVTDKDGFFVNDDKPTVCKRAGSSCDWESERKRYRDRGRQMDDMIHGSTRHHSTVDYGARLNDRTRYSRYREESPDTYPEDLVGDPGYDNEYNLPTDRSQWSHHSVRSRHRRGQTDRYDDDLEPITTASYGRGRRRGAGPDDDEDAAHIMTHDIYGYRDRVAYEQTASNDVRLDSRGNPVRAANWERDYTPAAQQPMEGYRTSPHYPRSGERQPRNLLTSHENVANEGGARLIRQTNNEFGGGSRRATIRRESEGRERDRYYELVGQDNGRTMGNMAARNPEFEGYRLERIKTWEDPAPGMEFNFRRKDRHGRY